MSEYKHIWKKSTHCNCGNESMNVRQYTCIRRVALKYEQ